jgi:light-independent protochlorophyllide reductase subunit N
VVTRLLERRPDIRTLFLVGSCPSEVIKLDLSRAAQRLSQRFAPQVRVLNYSGSGIETTFTQGEDACLASLVPGLPASTSPSLVVVGALADVVEDQFARLFAQIGIGPVASCRRGAQHACRRSGPNTRYLLAQPFLADTARALGPRRAACRALPAGRRRHHAPGCRRPQPPSASARTLRTGHRARARARRSARWRRQRQLLQGKSIFFFPDSQLEIRWRASCRANWACAHRGGHALPAPQHLAEELALLPAGTRSAKASMWNQLDRCRAARPTSWSAAWAWPTRWRPKA